jgi:hypothetical protein
MKAKYQFFIYPPSHSFAAACMGVIIWVFGVFSTSAQTGDYLYSGSEQTITLNPGLYDISAYGAQGGGDNFPGSPYYIGGLGAEMEGEFSFSGLTTLTILVGGVGGGANLAFGSGGGGGGGSFVVNGSTPLVVAGGGGGCGGAAGAADGSGLTTTSGGSAAGGGAGGISGNGGTGGAGGGAGGGGGGGSSFEAGSAGGGGLVAYGGFGGGGGAGVPYPGLYGPGGGGGGYSGGGGGYSTDGGGGGGSYIDSSAFAVLTEVSGVASPDGSPNGEIIITAVPEPGTLAVAGLGGLSFLLFRRQRA